jgi:hypothetical protein
MQASPAKTMIGKLVQGLSEKCPVVAPIVTSLITARAERGHKAALQEMANTAFNCSGCNEAKDSRLFTGVLVWAVDAESSTVTVQSAHALCEDCEAIASPTQFVAATSNDPSYGATLSAKFLTLNGYGEAETDVVQETYVLAFMLSRLLASHASSLKLLDASKKPFSQRSALPKISKMKEQKKVSGKKRKKPTQSEATETAVSAVVSQHKKTKTKKAKKKSKKKSAAA